MNPTHDLVETRAKSIYQYKLNEYNQRQIMRRENKHNARWATYATCATPEAARETLLKLEAGRRHKEGRE